ncbi:hypothetical protein SBOR_6913 [Sclerotinia borealis F-4128]|uniref:SNF2 N-terminal domain-containing protein n=1 Tax=Sclerotinia borealis (strain F-4128) TaxID=1432307 RepID=W9CA24_SCLBF|nr:hypothetical protein SBOR_6913 [Sclerotinia borealis F-4128]
MPQSLQFYQGYPNGPTKNGNFNATACEIGLGITSKQLISWYSVCKEIFAKPEFDLFERIKSGVVDLRNDVALSLRLTIHLRQTLTSEFVTEFDAIDAIYHGWVDNALKAIIRQAKNHVSRQGVRQGVRQPAGSNPVTGKSASPSPRPGPSTIHVSQSSQSIPCVKVETATDTNSKVTANEITVNIHYLNDPRRTHNDHLLTFVHEDSAQKPLALLQGKDFDFQLFIELVKNFNESRLHFNPETDNLFAYPPDINDNIDSQSKDNSKVEAVPIEYPNDFRFLVQNVLNANLSIINFEVRPKSLASTRLGSLEEDQVESSVKELLNSDIDTDRTRRSNTHAISPNLDNTEPNLDDGRSKQSDSELVLDTNDLEPSEPDSGPIRSLLPQRARKHSRPLSSASPSPVRNQRRREKGKEREIDSNTPDIFFTPQSLKDSGDSAESTKNRPDVDAPSSSSDQGFPTGETIDFAKLYVFEKNNNERPGQEKEEADDEFEIRLRRWKENEVDIITQRMQAQLESNVCEQLDENKWSETCTILGHPKEMIESKFCVKIAGMARRLLPCQAHAVVRTLMMWNSNVHSTFHAHAMGLGKSTITLATCHIQHLINCMYDDISREPQKHLSSHRIIQDNRICPSNDQVRKQYGLDCPCTKSHPISKIKPSLGIHIIIAPLGLLTNWQNEWNSCYEKENPFGMQLVIAHRNFKAEENISIANRKLMLADIELGEADDRHPHPICKPNIRNSRIVCVTTSHSLQQQLIEKFERIISVPYHSEGSLATRSDGSIYTTKPKVVYDHFPSIPLVVSSLWRDEAHAEKLPTSKTIQHPTLNTFCHDEMTELGKSWDKKVKQGNADEEASRECVNILRPVIEATTLRFDPDSNFLGAGPVVLLPPNRYLEVVCNHNTKWSDRLLKQREEENAEYEQKEKTRYAIHMRRELKANDYVPLKREHTHAYYRSRVFASFPFLMDISQLEGENPPLRFTEKEWSERHKLKEDNVAEDVVAWNDTTDPCFNNCNWTAGTMGNKNKETFSWLYYIENNERENTIRQRNHVRKGITGALERKVIDSKFTENKQAMGDNYEQAWQID